MAKLSCPRDSRPCIGKFWITRASRGLLIRQPAKLSQKGNVQPSDRDIMFLSTSGQVLRHVFLNTNKSTVGSILREEHTYLDRADNVNAR